MRHIVYSPAKINIFLRVLSRRPDGYHNIASIVTPVSLYDVIHINERTDSRVVIDDDRGILPKNEGNTMFRAVMLLRERYQIDRGIELFVEKNIPVGGGLGGPSSNAASVLKHLVKLWEINLSAKELIDLGKPIGADVPLFLYGKSCMIEGIGEIVTPMQLPPFWCVIIYPRLILKAKDVYEGVKIVLTKKENDIKLFGNFETIRDVVGILENDLEHVSIAMYPRIQLIKERLRDAGALGTLMSGSGSSVFGIFKTEGEAIKASQVTDDLGSVFVAHTV